MTRAPLTRGERTRTVLLLRCAVYVAVTGNYVLGPGWETAPRLGLGKRECKLAERAMRSVAKKTGRPPDSAGNLDAYVCVALEAARCIEEGSWP